MSVCCKENSYLLKLAQLLNFIPSLQFPCAPSHSPIKDWLQIPFLLRVLHPISNTGGDSPIPSNNSGTPTECSIIKLNSDTLCLEMHHIPQPKESVPQEHLPLQLSIPTEAPYLYFWEVGY